MKKNIVIIRAHHFLCIQGFQGYGYDKAFTLNLKKIIKQIDENIITEIKIVAACDIICSACPHNKNDLCEKNENSAKEIQTMDLKVLEKLDLKNGTIIKPKDIFSLIDKKIITSKDKQTICGNCSWKDDCLWYIKPWQKHQIR